MNIEYYDIKSERQENGLWGTPMNLLEMDSLPINLDWELHSAIIIAINENHNKKFKIQNQSEDSCLIYFFDDVFKNKIIKNMYVVKYDDFMLEGNRLYFIKNEKERRYLKLNKINESIKNR